MTIAAVVTRGFNVSVGLVVTRGYTPGAEVVDTRNRGGWLSDEQVRRLKRIERAAQKADDDRRKALTRREAARFAELAEIYDRVNGLLPPEQAKAVAEAVRPYSAPSDKALPPRAAIDWPALQRNVAAVQALARGMMEQANDEEEEAIMLLLMNA